MELLYYKLNMWQLLNSAPLFFYLEVKNSMLYSKVIKGKKREKFWGIVKNSQNAWVLKKSISRIGLVNTFVWKRYETFTKFSYVTPSLKDKGMEMMMIMIDSLV